ncbi:MAG: hypothetical protein JXP34_21625 [Planctomycetes bacterium]|nr:hypothetical protein [Planctomycetota bacterium]
MGSSVGISVTEGEVRVVHVAGSARRPKVRTILSHRIADGDASLADRWRSRRIPASSVTVAIPSTRVTIRRTVVPLTNLHQIRHTMKFHAERLLPGISPEEIALDFVVTRQEKDATELLLVIVRRADLEASLASLRVDGVRPKSVTVDVIALFNLLARYRQFDGAQAAAALDFADDATSLLLVRDGRLQFIRKFVIGDRDDGIGRLTREIGRSIAAADFPPRLDRIVVAGVPPEGLDLEGLAGALSTEIKVFRAPDVLRVRGRDDEKDLALRAPAAVGAALEGRGRRAVSLNLLRQEEGYRTPYDAVRTPLLVAAVAGLMLLGAELISTMHDSSDAAAYRTRLEGHAKALYARVVPSGKPRFSSETFHKTIESIAKQKVEAGTAGDEWLSFVDFLRVLTEHLPAETETVIQSISFRGQKATIRGETRDADSFDAVARELEASGKFDVRTPFRMRTSRRDGPSTLAFTIELAPRGKP